jgi:hypothetical protein
MYMDIDSNEEIDINTWSNELHAKITRFIRGWESDKEKEGDVMPSKQTRREWNEWLLDTNI